MRFVRVAAALLIAAVAASFVAPPSAQAESYYTVEKVYKVQVAYWFWDSDYSYWSTYYETTDYGVALFLYDYLLDKKANGQLNAAAPHSYWRYVAVDVRLIYEYQKKSYDPPSASQHQPSSIGPKVSR